MENWLFRSLHVHVSTFQPQNLDRSLTFFVSFVSFVSFVCRKCMLLLLSSPDVRCDLIHGMRWPKNNVRETFCFQSYVIGCRQFYFCCKNKTDWDIPLRQWENVVYFRMSWMMINGNYENDFIHYECMKFSRCKCCTLSLKRLAPIKRIVFNFMVHI